jgi:hypothetical protein
MRKEGSTTFKLGGTYYLTYSANNWESPSYGVGYATAPSPLGPFKKYAANPILHQDPSIGMYSTGHGSLAFSPDDSEMYYVHHGRPTTDAGQRRLYTERMTLQGGALEIDESTSDRPVPSGVAPYGMTASASSLRLRAGTTAPLAWQVTSAAGADLALANPLNRVSATVANPRVAEVRPGADGFGGTVVAKAAGQTTVTLSYQREHADGAYFDVIDDAHTVSLTVGVKVTGG